MWIVNLTSVGEENEAFLIEFIDRTYSAFLINWEVINLRNSFMLKYEIVLTDCKFLKFSVVQFLQRVFSIDTIVKPLPPAMAYNASRNLHFFTRIFTQFFGMYFLISFFFCKFGFALHSSTKLNKRTYRTFLRPQWTIIHTSNRTNTLFIMRYVLIWTKVSIIQNKLVGTWRKMLCKLSHFGIGIEKNRVFILALLRAKLLLCKISCLELAC